MLALVLVAVAYGVFLPLEARFSRPGPRRSQRSNLAMIVPVLLANFASAGAVVAAAEWTDDHDIGLAQWLGLSPVLAIVMAIVLLDLIAYFVHRLAHGLPVMWGLHRAHHTDTDIDITSTLRTHPLEVALNNVLVAGAVIAVGAGATAAAVAGFVGLAFGLAIHTRLQLSARFERIVGAVFQTPALHRMHHSPFRHETDTNFGTIFVWWDQLFGTYCAPDLERATGLDTVDLDRRQSVVAMLAEPWRPLVKDPAVAVPSVPTTPVAA